MVVTQTLHLLSFCLRRDVLRVVCHLQQSSSHNKHVVSSCRVTVRCGGGGGGGGCMFRTRYLLRGENGDVYNLHVPKTSQYTAVDICRRKPGILDIILPEHIFFPTKEIS